MWGGGAEGHTCFGKVLRSYGTVKEVRGSEGLSKEGGTGSQKEGGGDEGQMSQTQLTPAVGWSRLEHH